jgi:hypothetical protein
LKAWCDWGLRCFGPYLAKKALILDDDAFTLTLTNMLLSFIMVTKYTNLYDPGAYDLVSILPTGFFYKVILLP